MDMHHSIDLFKACGSKKELYLFSGSHNSKRDKGVVERGFNFI